MYNEMHREHRYPHDLGPRRGIYDRLGPPPGPRPGPPFADHPLGRPGAAPQRVLRPESDYPTPCIPLCVRAALYVCARVRVWLFACIFYVRSLYVKLRNWGNSGMTLQHRATLSDRLSNDSEGGSETK